MFMCRKCHEQDEKDGCPGHYFASYGKCELCGTTRVCFDCHHYKSKPQRKKKQPRVDK